MASSLHSVGIAAHDGLAIRTVGSDERRATDQPHPWLHALIELPEALDWIRMRLELALYDAKERRLNGLIGQYRAFQSLGEASLPHEVCEGYREIGTLLHGAGHDDMGACAQQVADLLEHWLAEGVSGEEIGSAGAWRTSDDAEDVDSP